MVGIIVPDYRGYFLRHVGGNSSTLGIKQDDAIRNIWARWASKPPDCSGDYGPIGGAVSNLLSGAGGATNSQRLVNSPERLYFDASRIVPTANENRPINKAVKYIIRATN